MRNHKEFVTVELGPNGLPCRIFQSRKLACLDPRLDIAEMRRGAAVRIIRQQVAERAAGRCEKCGEPLGGPGEMHEKNPRGMTGHVRGEYSLENSILVCRRCHKGAHANRRPQWSKPTATCS
jgi:5-methylcytosine-specific restriction endonuclease McrA